MGKAKYSPDKKGYYKTSAWDGTYTATGQKHYVTLRTKQSSRELERMVNALKNDVENRKLVVDTGSTFLDYAREYYKTYKAVEPITQRKCTATSLRSISGPWKASSCPICPVHTIRC